MLALGKLYRQALIIPAKLDERLRRIAALVSGGLTDANLAAATKLPASAFVEGRHVFVMELRAPQDYYAGDAGVFPALPVAATLLRIEGAWAMSGSDVTVSLGRWKADGTWEDLQVPIAGAAPAWAKLFPTSAYYHRGGFSWAGELAFAAGDHLAIKLPAHVLGAGADAVATALFAASPIA